MAVCRKISPPDIANKATAASQLKLYLQQDVDSTHFIFTEENRNKIRISICPELSCSCTPQLKDHCIHTIYVLLKIFRLSPTDYRLLQPSYSEQDLEDFIRSRYNIKPGQRIKRTDRTHKRTSSLQSNREPVICRKSMTDRDLCPICHDNMKENEGITYCSTGCGINIHMKCLLIWAENPHNIGIGIYCPSCRRDNGSRTHEKLLQDFEEFKSKDILHKDRKCGACKSYGQKCIKGKLFHCLHCENFELCEKCYLSYEHFGHTKFLVKETVNDTWKPAQTREMMYPHMGPNKKYTATFDSKNKDIAKFEAIDQRVALLNMNLAGFENQFEDKIISDRICIEKDIPLEEFIASCFPEASEQKPAANDKESAHVLRDFLGEVHSRKSCCYCSASHRNQSTLKLRKLFCGHFVHHNCLIDMISRRVLKCPDDNSELLKGYSTAFPPPKLSLFPQSIHKISGGGSPKVLVLKSDPFNGRFTIKGGHQFRKIKGQDFSINGTSIASYSINDGEGSMMFDRMDSQIEQQSFQSNSFFDKLGRKRRAQMVKNLPRIGELREANEQLKQTIRISVTKRPYINHSLRESSIEVPNRGNMSLSHATNANGLPVLTSTIIAIPRMGRVQRSVDFQKMRNALC